jgi:hypothetical protein
LRQMFKDNRRPHQREREMWQMQQMTTAEVRLDRGEAVGSGASRASSSPVWLRTEAPVIESGCDGTRPEEKSLSPAWIRRNMDLEPAPFG